MWWLHEFFIVSWFSWFLFYIRYENIIFRGYFPIRDHLLCRLAKTHFDSLIFTMYISPLCVFLKLQKYFALFLLHLFFLQIFCSLSVPVNHSFVYSARSFIVSWVDFVITRWWRRCIILFLLWKQNWIILWHPVATNWIYTKFQMNSILHSPLHASPPVIHEICHSLPHFVIVYCRPTLIKQSRSSRALGRGQAKYCLFSQALPYFFFGILYLREASNDQTLSTKG